MPGGARPGRGGGGRRPPSCGEIPQGARLLPQTGQRRATSGATTVPRTKRLTDATLVRRSQQGDRRAFRALLGRYDWRLRGLAYALLLDRAEMDVAVTTGYVRAWRDVVRIKPKDDVATWLYRVTYNACIDRLRHLEAAAARAASEGEPAAGGPREELTGIAAGLASLSAPERVAVVLVDREGFSPSSAARILGQTPGTLQRLLQRARDKLAAHVDEQGLAAPAPATDAAEEAATAEAGAAGDAGGEPSPAAEASAGPDAEVDAAASEGSAVEPEAVAPAPDPGAPAGGAAVADTAEPGAPAADGAA
nr:RNA polymerase sigma factor [Thermoanaerobacterales bacterium]